MKRIAGLLLLAVVLVACGADAAPTTSTTSTSSTLSVGSGDLVLSGLGFEVHQEPG